MASGDDDQLSTRLGVEDPRGAVRTGGRDTRAVPADVDAAGSPDLRVRPGVLVELEALLAGLRAPDPHIPFGPRARHKRAAVPGESDAAVLGRVRPRQHENLAAARRRDVP